jgi:esterase/lipase superfamily enzyme
MNNVPYLMVTNRVRSKTGLTGQRAEELSFFAAPAQADVGLFKEWTQLSSKEFEKQVLQVCAQFPALPDEENSRQKHLSLFVHGYNNSWKEAARRYAQIRGVLFDQPQLGALVLYTWPSEGSAMGYLPDREDARNSGQQSADLFVRLHDLVLANQKAAAMTDDPAKACKAKISIIAHSMGNYVVQKGPAVAAKRLNSPQLVTLIHQLAMVARTWTTISSRRTRRKPKTGR